MKFDYTDYKHVELNGGIPATTFLNQSYESRLELEHQPIGIVKGVLGFQSVNSQFSALGAETIVPKSAMDSYGLFCRRIFRYWQGQLRAGCARRMAGHCSGKQLIVVFHTYRSVVRPRIVDITRQHQLSLAVTQSQRAPQIQEIVFQRGS